MHGLFLDFSLALKQLIDFAHQAPCFSWFCAGWSVGLRRRGRDQLSGLFVDVVCVGVRESEDAEAGGTQLFEELGRALQSALCEEERPVSRAMGVIESEIDEGVKCGKVRGVCDLRC